MKEIRKAVTGAPMDDTGVTDATGFDRRRDWCEPKLRRLPISATAKSGGKALGNEDDGQCTGKGDVTNANCS
jgi:hypothetical protein